MNVQSIIYLVLLLASVACLAKGDDHVIQDLSSFEDNESFDNINEEFLPIEEEGVELTNDEGDERDLRYRYGGGRDDYYRRYYNRGKGYSYRGKGYNRGGKGKGKGGYLPCCPCNKGASYYGYNNNWYGGGKRGPSCRRCPCKKPSPSPSPRKDSRIGTTVYNDLNANGRRDPGEPGIGGVTIALYRDNDMGRDCRDRFDRYGRDWDRDWDRYDDRDWDRDDRRRRYDFGGCGNVHRTTITDSSGYYIFRNLRRGTYYVVVTDYNYRLDRIVAGGGVVGGGGVGGVGVVGGAGYVTGGRGGYYNSAGVYVAGGRGGYYNSAGVYVTGGRGGYVAGGRYGYDSYYNYGPYNRDWDGYRYGSGGAYVSGGYYNSAGVYVSGGRRGYVRPTGPRISPTSVFVDGREDKLNIDFGYHIRLPAPLPCCPCPKPYVPYPAPYAGKRGKRRELQNWNNNWGGNWNNNWGGNWNNNWGGNWNNRACRPCGCGGIIGKGKGGYGKGKGYYPPGKGKGFSPYPYGKRGPYGAPAPYGKRGGSPYPSPYSGKRGGNWNWNWNNGYWGNTYYAYGEGPRGNYGGGYVTYRSGDEGTGDEDSTTTDSP